MLPTIEFTYAEHQSQMMQLETQEGAAKLFRVNGCLLLKNVFPVNFITRLREGFLERYCHYFESTEFADALTVGDKRYLITVDIRPPFNTPLLYANPFVLPIIQRILGKDCYVGSFTAVVSQPGAKIQHLHRDHPELFPGFPRALIPSYAVALFIPLVELNDRTGTTRMWPKSHIMTDNEAENIDFTDPHIPLGSCGFMDYRLLHRGMANQSQQVRPILYLLYNRPWFKDYRNHEKQPLLMISPDEYQTIPATHRHLFEWLRHDTIK